MSAFDKCVSEERRSEKQRDQVRFLRQQQTPDSFGNLLFNKKIKLNWSLPEALC